MSRIDDAVSRIIRVKLQSRPVRRVARDRARIPMPTVMHSPAVRELAREAVRKSLVLLKNDGGVLPLKRGGKILVVGKGADSLPMQAGGWSLTWQGDKTTTSDYPNADTLLVGDAQVAWRRPRSTTAPTAPAWTSSRYSAIVMVAAEKPYAEMRGRHRLPGVDAPHQPLSGRPRGARARERQGRAGRHRAVLGPAGRRRTTSSTVPTPSSRPGCRAPKGMGLADMLLARRDGRPAFDFTGRLSFDWPAGDCLPQQGGIQFRRGYGLSLAQPIAARAACRNLPPIMACPAESR